MQGAGVGGDALQQAVKAVLKEGGVPKFGDKGQRVFTCIASSGELELLRNWAVLARAPAPPLSRLPPRTSGPRSQRHIPVVFTGAATALCLALRRPNTPTSQRRRLTPPPSPRSRASRTFRTCLSSPSTPRWRPPPSAWASLSSASQSSSRASPTTRRALALRRRALARPPASLDACLRTPLGCSRAVCVRRPTSGRAALRRVRGGFCAPVCVPVTPSPAILCFAGIHHERDRLRRARRAAQRAGRGACRPTALRRARARCFDRAHRRVPPQR